MTAWIHLVFQSAAFVSALISLRVVRTRRAQRERLHALPVLFPDTTALSCSCSLGESCRHCQCVEQSRMKKEGSDHSWHSIR